MVEVRKFLTRVLPDADGGYIGVVNRAGGNTFTHLPAASLDELDAIVTKYKDARANIYFAVGTFAGNRSAKDALDKKAFFVDIDCGAGKEYHTKRDAIQAVVKWCDDTSFPRPSIIVDSGNGAHVYWTIDTPIPTAQWQPMAERLKQLMLSGQVDIDTVVTADAARIMRCPGTLNCKNTDNPRPVRVLHSRDEDYTLEEITTALGMAEGASAALRDWADDDDLVGGVGLQDIGDRPRYAARMLKRCPVMKNTYETGGANQAEPLWMQQLHLLAYCVDGEEFIHAISDQHTSYDYQRTVKKYQQRLARKEETGPTLCKTLGKYFPEKCAGCRYNGAISTPLQLGSEEANEMPLGYVVNQHGVCRSVQVLDKESGKSVTEYIRVFPERITEFTLFKPSISGQGTNEYTVRFELPDSPRSPSVNFALSALKDSNGLAKALSLGGISLTPDETKEFAYLMSAWIRKMKKARLVSERIEQMGWTKDEDNKVGFALANRIHWADGTNAPVSFGDTNLSKLYAEIGERQHIVSLLRDITAQGREPVNALIASSFAAPLVRYTGVAGALLAVVSEASGTGKSAALRIAQSIWGCPVRGVNSLNDTPLSVAKKLGFINNLPAYWDELRMKEDVRNFVKLVFQLGQGKERSRLTSRVETQTTGTWQTLMVVASNESVYDHVTLMVSNTNAGALRVFEVDLRGVPNPDPVITTRISNLDANYGWVGSEYAKWLAENHIKVAKLVESTQLKFAQALSTTADERFWLAVVSSIYVGAALSVKLGFTNIDLPALKNWLIQEVRAMRHRFNDDYEAPESRAKQLLLEYYDKHRDQIVVCDHLPNPGVNPGTIYNSNPIRGEVLGLVAMNDKALRTSVKPFKLWLYDKQGETPTQVLRILSSDNGAQYRKASVSYGVGYTMGHRVKVLDTPLDTGFFSELVDAAGFAKEDTGA